ncbi:FAD-binding oxidoreductase [Phaeacidiphilus oryzae]|uniref:FAD-binding oxidoreductase n=1 Tax=Phaeacidiphilus oryzae TaxID=348818 RepID=UPI00068DCD77|nr:FAD-binding oxidoreductase [Phaeacidiphilus oryzae]
MPVPPYVPTSHKGLHHQWLEELGQDWSVVAEPDRPPRPPFKVYLPRDAEEAARALRECALLGEPPVLRGQAHSSNELVTAVQQPQRGGLLLTTEMNRVLDVDPVAGTATVQSGAVLADIDRILSEHPGGPVGLPVIGDHTDITAGGFASVGGVGPASHRFGLFADNVVAAQYATPEGELRRCALDGPPEERRELLRLLLGTGRHGLLTELTLRTIPIDKYRTLLRLHRHLTTSLDEFLPRVGALLRAPDPAMRYERVIWLDVRYGPFAAQLGEICAYHASSRNGVKSAVEKAGYGYLKGIGFLAGRWPSPIDETLRLLGTAGVFTSPLWATVKDVERFTDLVMDYGVGDPPRWLVSFVPADRFEEFFEQARGLLAAERARSGAVGDIAMFAKGIDSRYLAGDADTAPPPGGTPPAASRRYAEVICFFGCPPDRMTAPILAGLVDSFDELTLRCGGYRYLHTLTTTDPERRARLDANTRYAAEAARREKAEQT